MQNHKTGRPAAGSNGGVLREALAAPKDGPLAPLRQLAYRLLKRQLMAAESHVGLCRTLGISQDAWARLREIPDVAGLVEKSSLR